MAAMYNFHYKTSFFLATTTFSAANKGRMLFEVLLTSVDSSNITILPPDVTKLIIDIVGGVVVGLPGILIILKLLLSISLNVYSSICSGYCAVIDSILYHLCSDTVAHDWLSKVCSW